MPTPTPDLPYTHVGTDVFEFRGKKYLILVDYYSKYIDAVELRTQLDKNTQAIQAILDVFSNWTPAPQDGGAALKAQSASLAATQLGDFSNIENENVTH